MALNTPPPSGVENDITRSVAEVDGQPQDAPIAQTAEAIYRLDPKTKIPVSKYEGPVWEGRKKSGQRQLSSLVAGWDEAEYYYDNTQDSHRKETAGNQQGNRNYGKDRRDSFSMTENIVYATVNAVVPNTYAKNPNVEVTMNNPQLEDVGVALEHLVNNIIKEKHAPGVNLKPKVKKSIVRCEITNEAWVMCGWTKRDDSAEAARDEIARIGKELEDAKDEKTIRTLEGELLALEECIDLLNPPGPWVKTLQAKQVIIDDTSVEDDFSDANWKMVEMFFPTNYLNARFRVKKPDGTYVSAYDPTHVVDANDATKSPNAQQEEIDNFKLFDNSKDNPQDYGYSDKRAYDRAKRTKVWYCFDKVKRRFYLYADNAWTFPIWCFDDPYKLPNFYPLVPLKYHSSPKANRVRGEVSHYLDQQDEINVIADELNRARVSLRDNTIFDSNVLSNKDVEDIVLNSNKKMKGVKVPEGKKLADLIMGPPMPTLQHAHLWDPSGARGVVASISGVMDAMKGDEFKTNTTNDAISSYNSISGVRLDEKRDAIEDFVGDIGTMLMYLWLQFSTVDATIAMAGQQFAPLIAKLPQSVDSKWIRENIRCSIEGGSTQKPTSAAKKAEALQVGQILGQFAKASPAVVLLVLKVFERAFDGIVITDQDWKQLEEGIQMQLQSQQAPPAGAAPQGAQPPADDATILAEMKKRGVPDEVAKQELAKAKGSQQQQ